jgi:hypothetical protein
MSELDSAPVIEVALDAIDIGPRLRRQVNLRASFVESIAHRGVIHPIVVRPGQETGRYELIVGHGRVEAMRLLNRTKIPARVFVASDDAKLDLELDENVERVPLSDLERSKRRREWCLREYAAVKARQAGAEAPEPEPFAPAAGDDGDAEPEATAEPPPVKKKRGRPKAEASDREVARATGVPRETVRADRQHEAAVGRYGFLGGVSDREAIALAKHLDHEIDAEAREALLRLLAERVEPERLGDAVRSLKSKSVAEQREIARLYLAESRTDRELAVTRALAREMPAAEGIDAMVGEAFTLFGRGLETLGEAAKLIASPAARSQARADLSQLRATLADQRDRWVSTVNAARREPARRAS